ncbi:hypothetical protein DFJ77DRAFT_472270 [Powellomyces hirtus]|nr:hypothetical protein DFJ77DRAFT_472270 [Powellomyces hirtus]
MSELPLAPDPDTASASDAHIVDVPPQSPPADDGATRVLRLFWRRGKRRHDDGPIQRTRHRAAEILDMHRVHIAIIALVLVDLALVITEIILSFLEQQSNCNKDPTLPNEHAHEEALWIVILNRLSIAILCLFCFEHSLRMFALGLGDYLRNPLHAFDAAVVVGSLVLELVLKGPAQEIVGLLIVLRCWRIVRVIDGVATAIKAEKEAEIHRIKRENQRLKNEISELRKQVADAGQHEL